jgi:hypothetical protein
VNSATAPGITGSTASATTGISVTVGTASVTTGVSTAGQAGAATVTDPGHLHAVGTLAVDNTGQPANVVYQRWYRQ